MGIPDPTGVVGTLKFNNKRYNLLDYIIGKEIAKKVDKFRKKMNIKILPIYPHIQKAIQYDYEIVNNMLYLVSIRFREIKQIRKNELISEYEEFTLKDVLGEDRVECSFVNDSLRAITKKVYFNIENCLRLQINTKEFYFKNGKFKYIQDKLEFIKHSRKLCFLNDIIDIEKDGFNVGLFLIDKEDFYFVTFDLYKFEGTKKDDNFIKSNMTNFEFFTLLTKEYNKLSDLKYNTQIFGEVFYNTKEDTFYTTFKRELTINEKKKVIDSFRLKNRKVMFLTNNKD